MRDCVTSPYRARALDDLAAMARTAVAVRHRGRLVIAGSRPKDVGYVDDGGEPILIQYGGGPTVLGRACLSVPAIGQGRVRLGGQLRSSGSDESDPELPSVHHECFAKVLRSGPIRLVRLAVDTVRLEDGCGPRGVTCAAYATAEPDLWVAFAPAVTQHLNEDHPELLARLAGRFVDPSLVVAAAAAALCRGGLDLDVVTPQGASRLRIPLGNVDDPHQLCHGLLDLGAARGRGDPNESSTW